MLFVGKIARDDFPTAIVCFTVYERMCVTVYAQIWLTVCVMCAYIE